MECLGARDEFLPERTEPLVDQKGERGTMRTKYTEALLADYAGQ